MASHSNSVATIIIDSSEDSDDAVVISKKSSTSNDKNSAVLIPDGDYDGEVLFVEPEDYSPKKKLRLEEEKRTAELKSTEKITSELAVTFDRKGVVFPHAREHCRSHSFKHVPQNSSIPLSQTSNDKYCEKCYCFVCDELSSKCEKWTVGAYPHCNAYAKNAYWERQRKIHKQNKNTKESHFEPILSCVDVPFENIFHELKRAEISSRNFYQSIQEIKQSLNGVSPADRVCLCVCHTWGNTGTNCGACSWNHGYVQQQNFGGYTGARNCESLLSMQCSKAADMVSSHLKYNNTKPSSAIVILDTITTALFSLDNYVTWTPGIRPNTTSMFSPLISLWLQACMHPKAEKGLVDMAKKRVERASKFSDTKLFLDHAKSLNRLLQDLKAMDDPSISKYLQGQYGLEENVQIAKARVAYLRENKMFIEAINYILCIKVTTSSSNASQLVRSSPPTKWCDKLSTRVELIDLLIVVAKYKEAKIVSLWPLSNKVPLPSSLDMLVPYDEKKDNSYAYHSCAIASLKTNLFKSLITGLTYTVWRNSPTNKEQTNEKLLEIVCFVMPTLFLNNNSLDCFHFYFEKFFSDGVFKVCRYASLDIIQKVQRDVKNLVPKLKRGKPVSLQDLKPEGSRIIPELFAIEVFATVAAMRLSIKSVMSSLNTKKLEWVCVSLLLNPDLQDRIFAPEIKTFVDNIFPKTGSLLIPLEIMEKWYSKLNGILYFNDLFQLAKVIFDEGHKLRDPHKALETKTKAVRLSQKLSESVQVNSLGLEQKSLNSYLKRIDEKFSSEAAKLGIVDNGTKCLEMKFLSEPSFESLDNVRKASSTEEAWFKKRDILLQFLDKNASKFQEVTIEIYARLEMFDKLKTFLSKRQDTNNCEKTEKTIAKIQTLLRPGFSINNSVAKPTAFVEATHEYVASCLVFGSFDPWSFKKPSSPISETLLDTVKMMHFVSPASFKNVLNEAFTLIKNLFLNNTVHQVKKEELVQWLKRIKEISISLKGKKDWAASYNALCRDLKRKPQIVTHLKAKLPN